jgi:hypothetical protein
MQNRFDLETVRAVNDCEVNALSLPQAVKFRRKYLAALSISPING